MLDRLSLNFKLFLPQSSKVFKHNISCKNNIEPVGVSGRGRSATACTPLCPITLLRLVFLHLATYRQPYSFQQDFFKSGFKITLFRLKSSSLGPVMLKHLSIELRQNARRLLLNFCQSHLFKIDCTSLEGVGLGTNGYKYNCPIIATYLLKKKTTKLLATTKRISPQKHMSMTISVCLCQG